MKVAQTADGKPLEATAKAPKQAICPHCGGLLTLRRRRGMDNKQRTYFWRHQSNTNLHCRGRSRPGG
jgi:hypothetical protein